MKITQVLSVARDQGQPQSSFVAVDRYIKSHIGHKLLTYLSNTGDEVTRLYSNQPDVYPIGGRKPMGPTQWGEKVLKKGEIFLGRDRAAMIWAFFDHEKLFSLGLGSVISVPIIYDGTVLGAVSMCEQEYYYTQADLDNAWLAATMLVPAFLSAHHQ